MTQVTAELAIVAFPVVVILAVTLAFIWWPHVQDLRARRSRQRLIEEITQTETAAADLSHIERVEADGPWAEICAVLSAGHLDFEPNGVKPPFSVSKAMREWVR